MTTALGNAYDKTATGNPIERRMVAGFDAALGELLPATATRVLDLGCGEGHHLALVAQRYPDAAIIGLDIAQPEWLRKWHGDRPGLLTGDAATLPFAGSSFDLVIALEIVEHVPDPRRALAEIARVGAGVAVLSVPWEPVWRIGNMVRGRYWRQLGNTPGHLQHFSRRRFLRTVGSTMTVEAVRRPLPWTFVRARVRP